MNFVIAKLSITATLAALVSAPALAEKSSVVNVGDVRVIAAHVNTNLGSFKGNVNVTATDGHEDVAAILNSQIAAAGYNVSTDNPTIRYTVKELYAGEAAKYTPPAQKSGKVGFGAWLDIIGTLGVCASFGTCNNVMFMANEVQADFAHVSKDVASKNGVAVPDQPKAPLLIVEYEVCRVGRSCANTIAASFTSDVTLDQLRRLNSEEGLPRAINIKKDQ